MSKFQVTTQVGGGLIEALEAFSGPTLDIIIAARELARMVRVDGIHEAETKFQNKDVTWSVAVKK